MGRYKEIYLNHFTKEEIANDAFNDQMENYLLKSQNDDEQYYINEYSAVHIKECFGDRWSLEWLLQNVNKKYNYAINTVEDTIDGKVLILMTKKGEWNGHIELIKVDKSNYETACFVIDDCLDNEIRDKYKIEIAFVKARIKKGYCNSFVAYLMGEDQSEIEDYIIEIYEKFAPKDLLFD